MAIPTRIWHFQTPCTGTVAGVNGLIIPVPRPDGCGQDNFLRFVVTWAVTAGVTLPAANITDNLGQSYTLGVLKAGSAGFSSISSFYRLGSAAGVKWIQATFAGGTPQFVAGFAEEWYNIATAAAADGNNGTENTGATTVWAAGSFTPAIDGDLILQECIGNGGATQASYTAMVASGFALQSCSKYGFQMASQFLVQTTHAAINPTITAGTSDGYISIAEAFKSAAAGTAPATGGAPRILYVQFEKTKTQNSAMQFPCAGADAIVLLMVAGSDNFTINAGFTDGNANSYTQIAESPIHVAGTEQIFYSTPATCTAAMTGPTITWSGTPPATNTVCLIGLVGTGSFDKSGSSSGNQAVGGDLSTTTIDPTGSSEVILSVGDQNVGTMTGLVGAGFAFLAPRWPAQDQGGAGGAGDDFTNDAQYGMYIANDSNPATFVWTEKSNLAALDWENIAVALNKPVPPPTPAIRASFKKFPKPKIAQKAGL